MTGRNYKVITAFLTWFMGALFAYLPVCAQKRSSEIFNYDSLYQKTEDLLPIKPDSALNLCDHYIKSAKLNRDFDLLLKAQLRKADLFFRKKEFAKSRELLDNLYQSIPRDTGHYYYSRYHHQLAKIYIAEGNHEQARAELNSALEEIEKHQRSANPGSQHEYTKTLTEYYYSLWRTYYYERRIRNGFRILHKLDALNNQNNPNNDNNWGVSYVLLGNPDSALYFFKRGLENSYAIKRYDLIVLFEHNIADIHLKAGNYDLSKIHFNKTVQVGLEHNNFRLVAMAYKGLAKISECTGAYQSALDYLYRSADLIEKHSQYDEAVDIWIAISRMYHFTGDVEQAVHYLEKSDKKATEMKNPQLQAVVMMTRAMLLADEKKYLVSWKLFAESLEELERLTDRQNSLMCRIQMGQLLLRVLKNKSPEQSELKFVRSHFGNSVHAIDTAESLFRESLQILEKESYKFYEVECLASYGELLLIEKKHRDALNILSEGIRKSEELGIYKNKHSLYLLQARALEETGNITQANKMLHKYIVYRDSALNESLITSLRETEARFETRQKEDEIKILNRDNRLKQLELKKATYEKNLISAGIFLLALGGWFFYRRNQQAQKQKMLRERSRMSADLHDDIGSTLSSIGMYGSYAGQMIDEGKPEAARPVLDEIVSISGQMGDEMNDIIWVTNPRNDTLGNLINRLRNYAARVTESKNIQLSFFSDSGLDDKPIEFQIRRNLFLLCKELINNSVKHSGCRNLSVTFKLTGKDLMISLSDDGSGFDMEDPTNGNGVKNIRSRAAELTSDYSYTSYPGAGTTFEMSIRIS